MNFKIICVLFLVVMFKIGKAQNVPPVFINEIHYWNEPGFAENFIEIAGAKKANLDNWSIYMYNGNGTVSHVLPLSGTIDNEDNLAGARSFLPSN